MSGDVWYFPRAANLTNLTCKLNDSNVLYYKQEKTWKNYCIAHVAVYLMYEGIDETNTHDFNVLKIPALSVSEITWKDLSRLFRRAKTKNIYDIPITIFIFWMDQFRKLKLLTSVSVGFGGYLFLFKSVLTVEGQTSLVCFTVWTDDLRHFVISTISSK